MKQKIQPSNRQKYRFRMKIVLVLTVLSFFVLFTGSFLVIMNLNNLSKMRAKATDNQGGGNPGNGEILCEFDWNQGDVKTATLGPDAIEAGKECQIMQGGRSGSNGLSPGGKEVNLIIPATQMFNLDGIDICIDYRRTESSGDFFTRENAFNFGMDKGFVTIKYCTENKSGKIDWVKEKTQFEIPTDPLYRTYRFIYTPTTGKSEIFVNGIIIWQHQGEKDAPMSWKNSGNIIIGRGIDGEGADRSVLDNLVIRNTESVAPLAESLLNFMLEGREMGGVKIHWSTSANTKVDYFTVERSEDGVNFTNVARVSANQQETENEYVYTDQAPAASSLVYYRLRQTFLNGKFSTHALSAIRFKSEKGVSIERINPSPFDNSCDISYYIPKTGRVWMQIVNDYGKIINTSTFEAPKGKNVHVFRDGINMEPGAYTFSLIFDGKKVSAKIIKG